MLVYTTQVLDYSKDNAYYIPLTYSMISLF